MRTFKVAIPCNPELLDLLFNLKRVVRTLLMPTYSIKQLCLASSAAPYYIAATELTHFHSEPLLTFALFVWLILRDSNPHPFDYKSNAPPLS